VGLEVYNEGPDHAFGGALSFLSTGNELPEKASHYVSKPKRVRAKVEEAMRESERRHQAMAGD
jgi:hypothetical protein